MAVWQSSSSRLTRHSPRAWAAPISSSAASRAARSASPRYPQAASVAAWAREVCRSQGNNRLSRAWSSPAV